MDYPVKTPFQLRPLLVGFRKAAGLTQAQMASHLGVTQQTYAQLEAKPESASMERLLQVLTVLKVGIVLTQTSGPANIKGRTPAGMRTGEPPVPVKKSLTKIRATAVATKTAGKRKSAVVTAASGNAQGSPKPVRRKPAAAASKKREDW
ncbi:helix-turn-helix transcriptional regulator [Caballeronia sp. 15715]|uniref:helix-turn-helix transcriptional regulator n=1 Tax=unclassified Caballeronia TaxID=2646786 RepID=UPI0039E2EAC7